MDLNQLDQWINTTLKNYKKNNNFPLDKEVELVEFLKTYSKSLSHLSVPAALDQLQIKKNLEMLKNKANTLKKGEEVFLTFSDGMSWVQLMSEEALREEGHRMRNCVGDISFPRENQSFYTLRDASGNSQLNVMFSENTKSIVEAKAFANKYPPEELYAKIKNLLEAKGAKSLQYKTKDWIISGDSIYFISNLPEVMEIKGSLDMRPMDLNLIKWPQSIKVSGNLIINAKYLKGDIPSFLEADTLIISHYKGQSLSGRVNNLQMDKCDNKLKLTNLSFQNRVNNSKVFKDQTFVQKIYEKNPFLGLLAGMATLAAVFIIPFKTSVFLMNELETLLNFKALYENQVIQAGWTSLISSLGSLSFFLAIILFCFSFLSFFSVLAEVVRRNNEKAIVCFWTGFLLILTCSMLRYPDRRSTNIIMDKYSMEVVKLLPGETEAITSVEPVVDYLGKIDWYDQEVLRNPTNIEYINKKLVNYNMKLIPRKQCSPFIQIVCGAEGFSYLGIQNYKSFVLR